MDYQILCWAWKGVECCILSLFPTTFAIHACPHTCAMDRLNDWQPTMFPYTFVVCILVEVTGLLLMLGHLA